MSFLMSNKKLMLKLFNFFSVVGNGIGNSLFGNWTREDIWTYVSSIWNSVCMLYLITSRKKGVRLLNIFRIIILLMCGRRNMLKITCQQIIIVLVIEFIIIVTKHYCDLHPKIPTPDKYSSWNCGTKCVLYAWEFS